MNNEKLYVKEGIKNHKCSNINGTIYGILGDFNDSEVWENLKEFKKNEEGKKEEKDLFFDLIVFDWSTSKFFALEHHEGLLSAIINRLNKKGKFYLPLERFLELKRAMNNNPGMKILEKKLKLRFHYLNKQITSDFKNRIVKGMPFKRTVGDATIGPVENWGSETDLFFEIMKI